MNKQKRIIWAHTKTQRKWSYCLWNQILPSLFTFLVEFKVFLKLYFLPGNWNIVIATRRLHVKRKYSQPYAMFTVKCLSA